MTLQVLQLGLSISGTGIKLYDNTKRSFLTHLTTPNHTACLAIQSEILAIVAKQIIISRSIRLFQQTDGSVDHILGWI
ncbi:hypothetical protein Hanom_Chr03g00263171 [Helianthus anomalus]